MTQREKLIELLENSNPMNCIYDDEVDCDKCNYKEKGCFDGKLTDYLLENGVVVLPCRCGECELYEQESCPMWDNGDDGWGAHWQGCDNGFCHEATKRR